MNTNKVLIIFLILLLSAGMIFAGGGQQGPAQVDPNAPVTIDVWCWNPRTNMFSIKTADEIYKRTHPNVSINIVETASNDVQSKIVTILAANQTSGLPDIFLCQDNDLMKNVLTFPKAFYPISDKVDMAKFAPYKVEKGTVDGKSYGLPYDNAATGFFLRRDYVEQAGLKVEDFNDATWDRVIELARIVKDKTGHPLLAQQWDSMDLLMGMVQSTGSWFFKADGSLDMLNNQTLRAALTALKQMIDEGIILMVNDSVNTQS